MKKLLCLLLCAAMLMSLLPAAFAEDIRIVNTEDEIALIEAPTPEADCELYVSPVYRGLVDEEALRAELRESLAEPQEEAPLYDSPEAAVAAIRTKMTQRQDAFSVRIVFPSRVDDVFLTLVEQIFEPTDDPKEGDYLHYACLSIGGGSSWSTESGKQICRVSFSFRYSTTAEQEQEVDAAVAALLPTLGLGGKSDREKLDIIYRYITDNVKYDYQHGDYYWLKYSAYAALLNKTCVCQGYACLLYRLLKEAGLDNRIVTGTARGDTVGHAWNIVRLGAWYYGVDSTWDAGSAPNYYNYLQGKYEFGLNHDEDDVFASEPFISDYPMAEGDCGPDNLPLPIGGTWYNLSWSVSKDVVTITGSGEMESLKYNDYGAWKRYGYRLKEVVLPNGLTNLSEEAFRGFAEMETITIPATVTSIGEGAFKDCHALKRITIPDSVTSLGKSCFEECYALSELKLSKSLTEIPESCFHLCVGLKELALPASIRHIGDLAFDACRALTALKLNEGLESLGYCVFYECSGMQTITLPASLREIGEAPFYWCSSLENIFVAEGSASFRSVDGVLFTKDGKRLNTYPDGRTATAYAVPQGVEALEIDAFEGTYALEKVDLPASLRAIESEAFLWCSLTDLYFRGPAPSFAGDAFYSQGFTAWYPEGDASWTEAVRQDYGGSVTWQAYDPSLLPSLSLSGLSTAGVALSWAKVTGAEKYALERKTDGNWAALKTLTALSFTDASLPMGQSAAYRLRAYVKGAWTEWSNEVAVFFNPFADVSGAKTIEYVAWAFNNGIVNGTGSTKFSPDNPCTRIQFVMMLWKMHGSPTVSGTNPFSDISGAKTTKAILWALDKGVINSGAKFDPDGNISRVQIVMMLWKLAGSPTVTGTNPFKDVSGKKTINAVLWAYQKGITKGTSSTTFAPNRDCTRVQLVVFLYKYNGIYHVI